MEQWDGLSHGWLALPFSPTHSCPAVSGKIAYPARVRPVAHEGPHHTLVPTPDKPHDTGYRNATKKSPQKVSVRRSRRARVGFFASSGLAPIFHTRLTYTTPNVEKDVEARERRTRNRRRLIAVFQCMQSPSPQRNIPVSTIPLTEVTTAFCKMSQTLP